MTTESQGSTPSPWPTNGLGVDALERGVLVDHAFPLDFSTDPDLINIEVWRRKGVTELVLRGELDLGARRYFRTVLAGVAGGSAALVVLDLSALTFMDAGSIELIHRCRAQLRALGRDLELRAPNPLLWRILDLTGLIADTSPGDGGSRLGRTQDAGAISTSSKTTEASSLYRPKDPPVYGRVVSV